MARRFSPAATAPPTGGHTGANTPSTPAMSPSAYKDGVKRSAMPHRRKKSARLKHHSKRRG